MTGGFAVVGYPAEYRNSGIMTFLVEKTAWSIKKTWAKKPPTSP